MILPASNDLVVPSIPISYLESWSTILGTGVTRTFDESALSFEPRNSAKNETSEVPRNQKIQTRCQKRGRGEAEEEDD